MLGAIMDLRFQLTFLGIDKYLEANGLLQIDILTYPCRLLLSRQC